MNSITSFIYSGWPGKPGSACSGSRLARAKITFTRVSWVLPPSQRVPAARHVGHATVSIASSSSAPLWEQSIGPRGVAPVPPRASLSDRRAGHAGTCTNPKLGRRANPMLGTSPGGSQSCGSRTGSCGSRARQSTRAHHNAGTDGFGATRQRRAAPIPGPVRGRPLRYRRR